MTLVQDRRITAGEAALLRARAAGQLAHEAALLRALAQACAEPDRAPRGLDRLDARREQRQALRRLRTGIRNAQDRLRQAQRALDAAPHPDPDLVRAVLVLHTAIRAAIDTATAA